MATNHRSPPSWIWLNTNQQVARWSALALGLVYGYTHNNSLVALENNRAEQIKTENRDRLIAQAKAEWSKKSSPAGGKKAGHV